MRYKTLFRMVSLAAIMVTLGFSQDATAGVILKNGVYVIQMSNSNLTVACSSDAEHAPLILWPTRPTANWHFETTGNGYYGINSRDNRLHGGDGKKGTPITMKRMGKDWINQMWKIVKVGRYYKFINIKTGQAMTLTSGKRTPGSRIENAPVADTMDQLFCIQRMDNVGYCGEGGPNEDYSDSSMPEKKSKLDEYLRQLEKGKAQPLEESPRKAPQNEPRNKAPEQKEFTNTQRP